MGTIQTSSFYYSRQELMLAYPFIDSDTIDLACTMLITRLRQGGQVTFADATTIDLTILDFDGGREDCSFHGECEDMAPLRRIVLFWAAGCDLTMLYLFLCSDWRSASGLVKHVLNVDPFLV